MKIFDEPLPYSHQLFHSLYILAMNGQADVKITYKSQVVIMPLVVVKGQGPILFDRNWLQKIKLDWKILVETLP